MTAGTHDQLLQHVLAGMPGAPAVQLAQEWLVSLALLHTSSSDAAGETTPSADQEPCSLGPEGLLHPQHRSTSSIGGTLQQGMEASKE